MKSRILSLTVLSLSLSPLATPVCFLALNLLGSSAQAVDKTWDGEQTIGASVDRDKWSQADNWDANTLPLFDGTENIIFASSFTNGLFSTDMNGPRSILGLSITTTQAFTIRNDIAGNLQIFSGDITRSPLAAAATISAPITLGGGAYTGIWNNQNAAGSLTVSNAIGETGGARSLTLTGVGTTIFSGANTYTGTTTISGGSLLMGAANVLPDSSGIRLNGGTLASGGFGDTNAGSLSLLSSSVIDLGSISSNLNFDNIGAGGWAGVLSVWNWTGNPGVAGGTDQLHFSSSSLTSGQLASIQFYSGSGSSPYATGATFVGDELVPVPEPGAVTAAVLLLGVVGWRERRTWMHYRPVAR